MNGDVTGDAMTVNIDLSHASHTMTRRNPLLGRTSQHRESMKNCLHKEPEKRVR